MLAVRDERLPETGLLVSDQPLLRRLRIAQRVEQVGHRLGFSDRAKVVLAVSVLFFVVLFNTLAGVGVETVLMKVVLPRQPNGLFAVLTILAIVSGVFSALLRMVEHRLLPWMPDRS